MAEGRPIELSDEAREEMAHRLAPVLKNAIAAAGPASTLLDAHSCLANTANRLEVSTPQLGPLGAAQPGVIIIITS